MRGTDPFFAEAAALMGEPARANILAALMDGRAHTAKELAFAAGVSAQTTSGHLARLVAGELVAGAVQGRHRYYRLAGSHVAQAVESLMVLAETAAPRHRPRTRAAEGVAEARTCYDHLAGRFGVALHDALIARGCVEPSMLGYALTDAGSALAAELGIATKALARSGRPLARPCLDWTERRFHLAGAFAAALSCRCLELGFIERQRDSRAVRVTDRGKWELSRLGLFSCEDAASRAA
jgi:DNA-binding transcriptional ArsR family regulator